jgi:hypothetical protein
MRDDEIDDTAELPPDEPVDESTLLERLDDAAFDELDAPDEQTLSGPPLSRQEIDDAVDRALAEELARLNDPGRKGK